MKTIIKLSNTKQGGTMNIGQRIKQLRIKNGLTLEELASRTELSKGFLSQLERDLTSPSISTLSDITEALGLSLSTFFLEEKQEKIVFSSDDFFVDERDGQTLTWIVPNAQKNDMEPIELTLKPGATSFIVDPHVGQEFGYVLLGKITLIDDNKSYVLKKGQTFYIHGTYQHYLRNDSNQIAKVIWVCTPPIF